MLVNDAIKGDSSPSLTSPLRLPCGVVLGNRVAKAAMTEGLANRSNGATDAHVRLYERWARGGAGLMITGNVQVDRRYLERPGNIVIEANISSEERGALRRMTAISTKSGGELWMQLSHAGRQTPKSVNRQPVAPSSVAMKIPGKNFGVPRALSPGEIDDIRQRFVHAAVVARECGFTGVQVHSAHGYLLSEFLSPRANQRTDEWGGCLENRARLLQAIVADMRKALGADFPISVKLNTSDFQRGGFSLEESLRVVGWLEAHGVDLLEISGGTYEQPKMLGLSGMLEPEVEAAQNAGPAREGYFMAHVAALQRAARLPLMVTGGFRTRTGMLQALSEGVGVIGLARPLCTEPELCAELLAGRLEQLPCWENSLQLGRGLLSRKSPIGMVKLINGFGLIGWYYEQLMRLGRGEEPDTDLSVWSAFWKWQRGERKAARELQAP